MGLDYQRHYGKWHDDTAGHWRSVVEYYRNLLGPHIHDAPRGAALDAGCGMGFGVEFLQGLGFDPVIGYDSDEKQISICQEHGLKALLSTSIENVLETFPGPFSVVTAIDFLEHIPPAETLATMRRIFEILKPSGVFVCRVPNANSGLGERVRYDDFTHHQSFTENSLDLLLYSSGFRNIEILPAELPRKRPSLRPGQGGPLTEWVAFRVTRGLRRLEFVAELGEAGWAVPLSLNLLGVVRK